MGNGFVRSLSDVIAKKIELADEVYRRKARIAALEAGLNWALNEIDAISNRACGFGYPQGIMEYPSDVEREAAMKGYEQAIKARALLSSSQADCVVVPTGELNAIADMIENCAGVDRKVDSLPMMVLARLRALLGKAGG